MNDTIVPDSEAGGIMARLPPTLRDLVLVARFDRPIGWWLLYWPGAWAIALAGGAVLRWHMFLWFLIGSIVMRGAGCVYNDIVDRDLDRRVARTALRPLASGALVVKTAWVWLFALSLMGLIVLLQLRLYAQVTALASLALIAAYPFMKRITWWPQVWLGLVFSWAALVGWSEIAQSLTLPGLTLYAGCILWVIGYDTIYALQDREDDALIGVRSSALRMGRHVRVGVSLFYTGALFFWAAAFWQIRPQALAIAALLPVAVHLAWQVITLNEDRADPLIKFRSNRFAGLLMFLACLVVGSA